MELEEIEFDNGEMELKRESWSKRGRYKEMELGNGELKLKRWNRSGNVELRPPKELTPQAWPIIALRPSVHQLLLHFYVILCTELLSSACI